MKTKERSNIAFKIRQGPGETRYPTQLKRRCIGYMEVSEDSRGNG